MKIIFITLIGLILISCNFFGPVESSIQTNNVDYNEKDITGKWKLDKFSYEYLSKKENLDSIYITFESDSTFILNNSVKLFDRTADLNKNEKINGKLDNKISKGKWIIKQYTNHKTLDITHENNTYELGLNVYKKGKDYQIWYFFNDPDSGQRLRFLKE
jgi:hypothetical protein